MSRQLSSEGPPIHLQRVHIRRGSVLLFAVFLIPVMLLGLGVMTEVGNYAVGRSMVQTAADSAAKAGAYRVAHGKYDVEDAVAGVLADAGLSVGSSSGTTDVEAVRVLYGKWNSVAKAFTVEASDSSEANAVRVEVDMTVRTVASGWIGLSETTHTMSATAFLPGVLLAVDNANSPKANDVTMMKQIRKAGYPVRLVTIYNVDEDLIVPGEVLFISSSVSSSRVDPALFDIDAPVVCGETNLYDSFGFTGGADGETHTTIQAKDFDCEIDVRKLGMKKEGKNGEADELDLDWRSQWQDWWDTDGKNRTNAKLWAKYQSGEMKAKDRVEYKAKASDGNSLMGYADRAALGNDAVVLSTVKDDFMKATTFWFDAGSKMGNGKTAKHKRAGIFTRTTEFSGSKWQYNQDGYDLLNYTIRWMLADETSRTMLVE